MKPSIPKGTRDFTPIEMERRNYIFDTIKQVFRKYGFKQIETPAMENLSTLLGKYGDEGDKLLFKILNSGDFLKNVAIEPLNCASLQIANKICEKGLRYDLTVPFARYVVQHREEISFPFRRFQIQPVWRADRPQKGRYREFYQCDADIIGSNSLLNEVELIEMLDEVFEKLKIRTAIKLNNRKILASIAELIGQVDKITDITVAIDKMDKIGLENVSKELLEKGISEKSIELLQPILMLQGTNSEKLEKLKTILKNSEIGLKGIEEIEKILNNVVIAGLPRNLLITGDSDFRQNDVNTLELDLTLARGLNYYTGAILEVKALDVQIGSISGGGRYDSLTGVFGLEGVSGVGVSFGADRIYDVLDTLNLFPNQTLNGTKILFVYFDENGQNYALNILRSLRKSSISSEIYPEPAKIKKQMQYANDNSIPFVAIVGDNEMQQSNVMLKNMETGEQNSVKIEEIIANLR
jgi:histidyl-tRNA synthetase